ncbi:primosomal protein N' [Candidatus Uhrbacteria bacterium]|nr:primosomal protein N' [Candidatus Uhrbacteria bacterium]
MYCTVLVSSRSLRIGDGLTYVTDDEAIVPGILVEVPLRGKATEGIVIDVTNEAPAADFEMQKITKVISAEPLFTIAQMKTLRWMAEHYCCTLRQALTAFLPAPPWRLLFKERKMKKEKVREKSDVKHDDSFFLEAALKILGDKRPALVLGSRQQRMSVYLSLIERTMKQGQQSILLQPDILLAEDALSALSKVASPNQIAIFHSGLSDTVRRTLWKRIRTGEVAVIIGTRSALFAPCKNLGLLIVDEEHEWTYKSEQAPRYHARETAEALAAASKAKLVCGSLAPSLESWKQVKNESWQLVQLPSPQQSPRVRVVDLGHVQFGSLYPFSPPLLEALRDRIAKKEQSVLFLNRRGTASALLCLECRRRVVSQASQLPFAVHRGPNGKPILVDHATGTVSAVPAVCPSCKSPRLHPVGAGTQSTEETLHSLFPKANILRADSDTLTTAGDFGHMLKLLEAKQVDILIGTLSVRRALTVPSVTFAAVLLADIGLSLPHFRAGEQSFQMLASIADWSRQSPQNEAMIQTYRPDAPEVQRAVKLEVTEYLDEELKVRETFRYPPVTQMIRFIVRGEKAAERAKMLERELQSIAKKIKLTVTTSAAPTLSGGGKTWHVLMRGTDLSSIILHIQRDEETLIDVDPAEYV